MRQGTDYSDIFRLLSGKPLFWSGWLSWMLLLLVKGCAARFWL